ncbi:MAG: DUF1273 domain-containing protein [Oscillospiraceae bacterium]
MLICTFTGHREVYLSGINAKITDSINDFLKKDTSFIFYTGGMGEFDVMCSAAVSTAKKEHRELEIKLVLVMPYMSNRLNTGKDYYKSYYDDIIIPEELQGEHYKSIITRRNRWMIDQADLVLAYVRRDFGGAFSALKYANKLKKEVINLADKNE